MTIKMTIKNGVINIVRRSIRVVSNAHINEGFFSNLSLRRKKPHFFSMTT